MSYRDKVVSLAADLASKHIGKKDAEYFNIAEGRTDWTAPDGTKKTYSWCGDFVTYVLTRAGATEKQWLNRVENNGTWKVGRNIIMLAEGAAARGGSYTGAQAYSRLMTNHAGDILIISGANGAEHVCLLKTVIDAKTYVTYDGNGAGGVTRETVRTLPTNAVRYVLDADAFNVSGQVVIEPGAPTDPYATANAMLAYAENFTKPAFVAAALPGTTAVVEATGHVVGQLAMLYDEFFNEGD